ncbi:fumarylacetoacetate hydrolase family protein [Rhodococcus sp. NBC_00297]|uniref:fumarylacetoacetate hydrolase family protein n=1 Tax=Rhodococcus sp. NBC_00297 TaxID=2976005 RepID=UPI002E28DBBA|nr:fumarylacetoacetate hydrolase family protein [Rhodococcus sp. NBC_00297]
MIDGKQGVLVEVAGGKLASVEAATNGGGLTMRSIMGFNAVERRNLLAMIDAGGERVIVDADGIDWLPPMTDPSKIVGVALNNDVFNYLAARKMTAPMYFLTPPSAMTGHGTHIEVDPAWGLVHPEPELAAVIGATLRRATPEDAAAGVFGYTIINDITSPGLKSDDSVELVMPEGMTVDEPWRTMRGDDDRSLYLTYHARSKGTDTFAPIGPWIVTADEITEPNDLTVRGYLDDDLVLEDSTANLTFGIHDVIAHLSQTMTLTPGDIVHFGTAARPVLPDRYPTIRSIDLTRHGHRVSVEINGLGRLDNPIRRVST